MLKCEEFYNNLIQNNIDFFCGVPNSILKNFCAFLQDNVSTENHIIAANEGNAIALASGIYLSSGKPSLVYMQNSGQGNALNPLVSLCDVNAYQIPVLLLIGWRGEPNTKDEPQHKKQGEITLKLLEVMDIDYEILPDKIEDAKKSIGKACKYMKKHKKAYAIVIKKNTFEEYKLEQVKIPKYRLSREETIKTIVDFLSPNDIIVSTTGMASRELFEYRKKLKQTGKNDFLVLGSMGHCSSIAFGIA